ncbi:MAG: hypothetical protein WCP52_14085, partial [Bacteroidota bacterium]
FITSPKERGRCVTIGISFIYTYIYMYYICLVEKTPNLISRSFAGDNTPAKASYLQILKSKLGTPTRAEMQFIDQHGVFVDNGDFGQIEHSISV